MKINKIFIFAAMIAAIAAPGYAAATGNSFTGDVTIASTVSKSIAAAAGNIFPMAVTWLGVFATIQFVVTNIGLLKSGADIEAVIGKFIGSIFWIAFCIYVLQNGSDFIDKIGTGILNNVAPKMPTVGTIISALTAVASLLLIGIGITGIMAAGFGSPIIAVFLLIVLIVVVGTGLLIAIKIFMLQIELSLIILLAPLSFSFLGLNALKDQGIAPFKSLISLVYRMILVGIVCGAFTEVCAVVTTDLKALDWDSLSDLPKAANNVLTGVFAFPILGYLVFKSDSIAASLASGSTNLGTSDVAAAAAMGAALASGGASAAAATGKVGQSMSDFMKGMTGNSSISNVGQQGAGGVSKPDGGGGAAKSMASQGSGGGKSAVAPPGRGGGGAQEGGGGGGLPNPRARPAPGGSGNGSSESGTSNALAMWSAETTGSAAQADSPKTQSWRDSSAGGSADGNLQTQLAGDTNRINQAATNGGDVVGAADKRSRGDDGATGSGGDGYGAELKKKMSQAQTAEAALQSTPLNPQVAGPADGSGASAGIGGSDAFGADLKKEMTRMADQMAKQSAPRKPTLGENIGKVNRQIAEEKGTTQVSINANAAD